MIPSNPTTLDDSAVFVLAGGLGSRMSCLTERRPKPLLSFAGHYRAIDFPLSNALDSGARRVCVVTQHHGSQIADYLEKGWEIHSYPRFATAVTAPAERPYRGTTDAVTRNLDLFGNHQREIVVLSADHIYQMDYADLVRYHREQDADVTIATTVVPRHLASSLGVVVTDDLDRVLHLHEKPENPPARKGAPSESLVSMGIYVFRPESLGSLASDGLTDLGRHAIPELIGTHRVSAYRFDRRAPRAYRYWADIGTLDSYFTSHQDLIDGRLRFVTEGSVRSGMMGSPRPIDWVEGGFLISPAAVVDTTEIHRSVVGPGVHVGRNTHVSNSILMPGASIGDAAIVRNAIVDEHAVVPDGDSVGLDPLIDRCRHFVTRSGIVVVSGPDASAGTTAGAPRRGEAGQPEPEGDAAVVVLVADADARYLDWARAVLESEGYAVVTVQSAARLMALAVRHRFDIRVAICGSLAEDGRSGTSARLLLNNLPGVPVILRGSVSNSPPTGSPQDDVRSPFGILTNPANAVELAVMVGEARSWGRAQSAIV